MEPFRPRERVEPYRIAWFCIMLAVVTVGMSAGVRPSRLGDDVSQRHRPAAAQPSGAFDVVAKLRDGSITSREATEMLLRDYPGVVAFGVAMFALACAGFVGGLTLLVLWRRGRRIKPMASWAPGAPWSPFDVAEVLVFFLFAQIVISFLVYAVTSTLRLGHSEGAAALALITIIYVLTGLATVAVMSARTPGGFRGLLRALRIRSGRTGTRIIQGAIGYAVVLPAFMLAFQLTPVKQHPLESNPVIPVLLQSSAPWAKALALFLVGFCAPVFEETLFRGFAYQAIKRRWGMAAGVIITAAVFAVAHQNPGGALALGVLGAGLAIIYEVTGSLLPCMVAHAAQNVLALIALTLAT